MDELGVKKLGEKFELAEITAQTNYKSDSWVNTLKTTKLN
jgi:hypothetical protein